MDTEISKQILKIKQNLLKIPTGGRLNSCLRSKYKRGRVEFGHQTQIYQWQGGRFKLGTTGLQNPAPQLIGEAVCHRSIVRVQRAHIDHVVIHSFLLRTSKIYLRLNIFIFRPFQPQNVFILFCS